MEPESANENNKLTSASLRRDQESQNQTTTMKINRNNDEYPQKWKEPQPRATVCVCACACIYEAEEKMRDDGVRRLVLDGGGSTRRKTTANLIKFNLFIYEAVAIFKTISTK